MSQMGTYANTGVFPPGSVVETLTGNTGGAVGPDLSNNINVVGSGAITVTGNPGTSTLTISDNGTIPTTFTEDTGSATPALNNLNVLGGNNIATTGVGSTVTIDLNGTTNHALQVGNATGSLTSLAVATNGQLPIGSTGADPVIANLTAGTGISITNGAGSITIASSGVTTLNYTSVTTTPYVVLTTDQYMGVTTTSLAITIELPNAPATGRTFMIKDSTGNAATNNITVTTVGGVVNIDGATSFVMNTAYEAINVIFNGTSYEIF